MVKIKISLLLLVFLSLCTIWCFAKWLPNHDSKYIDSLRTELQASFHDTLTVNIKNNIAKALIATSPDTALLEAKQALRLSKKISFERGLARSFALLGTMYLNRGEYVACFFHYFSALRIYKKINDTQQLAFIYNNIGRAYFHLKRYKEANQFYRQSLAIKEELKLNKSLSSTLINIGNILFEEKKYAQSLAYYQRALDTAIKYGNDHFTAIALMNMGEVHYKRNELKKSETFNTEALALTRKNADNLLTATSLLLRGNLFMTQKEYEKAKINLDEATQMATEMKAKDLLIQIYKSVSELHEKTGNSSIALAYYKSYQALKDTVYNADNLSQIYNISSKYDLQNKDEEIAELSKGNEFTQTLILKGKVLRNYLIVSFMLLLVIAVVMGRNIVLSKRVNKILIEKNAEIDLNRKQIEQQNRTLSEFNKELMKENISAKYEILKTKINPHFLFNSLSTLSNLIVKDQDEALDFVRRFSKLYRRILELGNVQVITIEEELDFVSEFLFLQKIRFKENLIYSFNVHKIHQRNFIPPFSIQLLVENAIKHNSISIENKLIIKVFSENECVIVSNNLQKKDIPEDSTKVGQKNIADRYRFISQQEPEFIEEESRYVVSLPIIKDAIT